jgi:uracil DNA glycosylase
MQEIVKKINSKLQDSNWYDELRIFLESSDFSDILIELKKKVEVDKQRFCPSISTAFRFMEQVPVDKIKTVLLIDYIPNKLEYATGMVLSNKVRQCDYVVSELLRTVGYKIPNPEKWVEQGVLVVPLALTCRIEGKAHKKLWTPFIMRLIESINKKHPNIPWVLIGSDTWKYEEDIASEHVRKMEFKMPFADKEWSQWINNIFLNQGKALITW